MRALRILAGACALASCHRTALPPRPDGAAVVIAAADPASEIGVSFVPEEEPNDTPATAQRLVLGATGPLGVRGAIGSGGATPGRRRDVDFYRIELPPLDGAPAAVAARADGGDASAPIPPPRGLLRVDLRPESSLRLEIAVIDGEGSPLLAALAAADGAAVAIPNLAIGSGPVILRVKALGTGDGAAGYRLTARQLPFEAGSEIEPNDRAPFASPLDPSGEAVGYLGWRNDQDWYRLPTAGLAEGSALSVDLDPIPEVAATLQVYDGSLRKLIETRGRKGERAVLRSVRIPPAEAALYLVVRALGAGNPDARYDLRSRVELLKPGAESEPNDDAAHAQAIPNGTIVGYLGRGDVDVFRYASDGPAELDVEAVPPERGSLRVEIQREDGVLLARKETSRRAPARIVNQAIPGGPVLIRLAPGRGPTDPDDPYLLTIAGHPPGDLGSGAGSPAHESE